jgi:peptidoglycan/xylan/chitin deacetylase (PgdA/CDA1 family)
MKAPSMRGSLSQHGRAAPASVWGERATWLQIGLNLQRVPTLSVLIYHRVLPDFDPLRPSEPTATEFAARMRWIAANFRVLPLSAAVKALTQDRLPRRALSITFDDGYADNHDLALPILSGVGLPATFFVATGYLDGGCMFNDAIIEAVRQARGTRLNLDDLGLGTHAVGSIEDKRVAIERIIAALKYMQPGVRQELTARVVERAGADPPHDLMMSTQQVAAMHRAGMEIGAHTVNHPILSQIGTDAARDEIVRSRAQLEDMTGGPVRLFAYPNGYPGRDYRREHAALVRSLGFDAAVSTACGAVRAGCDLFQLPRFTPWDRANWKFGVRLARNAWKSDYERV